MLRLPPFFFGLGEGFQGKARGNSLLVQGAETPKWGRAHRNPFTLGIRSEGALLIGLQVTRSHLLQPPSPQKEELRDQLLFLSSCTIQLPQHLVLGSCASSSQNRAEFWRPEVRDQDASLAVSHVDSNVDCHCLQGCRWLFSHIG